MCGTRIPLCLKCASGVIVESGNMPGTTTFSHCSENPEIDSYEKATLLCPLMDNTNETPKPDVWTIKEMKENPHPKNWPGRWFQFHKADKTPNEYNIGIAHESTLHLYVGKKQAEEALKHTGV